MATVKIDIASEFTGKKAFKQAETASDKLVKNTKKLAGAFGLAFGTAQVVAYGKAAVKAFAEDDKAATILSKTLSNLGLAFADPRIKTFIADLEKQYGVLDDFLRPAYQKLVTTTGNWQKSQELLRTALDLSAQSGVDLVTVAEDLGKAYVGNTKGLQKYSLGITKAELASLSFEDILKRITKISAGQAAAAADTYAGKLDKLTVASANLSEKIGGALLDAFIKFNGGDVDKATGKIETFGTAVENLIRLATGTGDKSLSEILNGVDYKYGFIPTDKKPNTNRSASPAGTAKRLAAEKKAQADALKAERERVRLAKEKAAAEAKALKDKRLGIAIDKATLALGKSSDVFDLDKIQVAAALTSQAEQLGKATSAAQVMQIANDTARLNVKKSISDLEDAIAAKDEKAIIAATAKLNEDIKILGTLSKQDLKLQDIKSILDSLKPKDLINLQNLEAALALLGQIAAATAAGKNVSGTFGGGSVASSVITSASVAAAIGARTGYDISGATDPRVTYGGQRIDSAGNYNSYNAEMALAMGAGRYQGNQNAGNTIIVNTGIGDPNAIAEAIDQVLTDAVQRGTLRQATP